MGIILLAGSGCGKIWNTISLAGNTTQPASPDFGIALLTRFPTLSFSTSIGSSGATNVAVSTNGQYLYVTNPTTNSINAYSAAVPTSPAALNSLTLTVSDYPFALEVFSASRMLVSVQGTNRVVWINTSVPGTPTLQGSLSIAQSPYYITHSGTAGYLVTQTNDFTASAGLLITLDLSTDTPVQTSQINLPGSGYDVAIDSTGKYLYVTDDYDSVLQIYSLASPLYPAFVASVGAPQGLVGTRTISIFKSEMSVGFWGTPGGYSYSNGGLAHYDISTPSNPVLLSFLETTVAGPNMPGTNLHACPVILNLGQNNFCTSIYDSQSNYDLSNYGTAKEIAAFAGDTSNVNASWVLGKMIQSGNYLYLIGLPSGSPTPTSQNSQIFVWQLQ